MIIYENTKKGFFNDIKDGLIVKAISNSFAMRNINHNNPSEVKAWENSLRYVRDALDDDLIEDDVKLAIEYQIPFTSKRVDFLIGGVDEKK